MYATRNANRNTAAFGTWMVENAPAPVETPAPAAKSGKAGRVFVSLIVAAAVIVALAIPALQILANV